MTFENNPLFRPKMSCNISEHYHDPFWEKSNSAEEIERRRRKKSITSGHLLP
jgi:hypothetical protein